LNNGILKLIKKRDIIILCIFLVITWIIGICNFSTSSYTLIQEFDFNKEKSISLYPDSVLSISNYKLKNNQFYTLHEDPQIYVLPPEQRIASTVIELGRPVSFTANVQVYYAINGEPLSEANSVINHFSANTSKVAINLPTDIFTALRYDINIIGEKFIIKGIYVSETPIEVNYIHSLIEDRDSIFMIITIDFFIILFWILSIKTGCIDKVVLNIVNTTQYIKNNIPRVIINISIILAIIIIAIIIENIYSYITNSDSINIYRVFLYTAIGFVFLFIIVFRYHPEKLFFLVSMVLGLLYTLSFPPYFHKTYDEVVHYRRAVEHSFIKNISISKSVENYSSNVYSFFSGVNIFNKQTKENMLADVNSDYNKLIVSNKYSGGMRNINNYIELYNSIVYIPAGLMIFIGRSLALRESNIFILGSICIHLIYTLIVYFALKRLNSGKYIMIVIALFPTVFFQSVTYTYDYWVISFIMLGFACFFHEIQHPEEKINIKNLIILLGSFVLGLSPKAIYFPLMLILYFLPKEKFNNKDSYKYYLFTVTFFIFFVIMSFMLPLMITRGGAFTDLRGGSDVSAAGQIKYILRNPKTYTIILLKTLKSYLSLSIGQNNTTSLAYLGNIPYHNLVLTLLGFVVITDKNHKDILSSNMKYRIVTSSLVFITVVLIITSMYIAFTGVGSHNIRGLQGRYLLPFLFPFFYILGSSKIQNNMNKRLYSSIIFGIMSFILLNGIWTACISKYN
jgi:uncharacterized membrane protein